MASDSISCSVSHLFEYDSVLVLLLLLVLAQILNSLPALVLLLVHLGHQLCLPCHVIDMLA